MVCPTCEEVRTEADFNKWTKQKCYSCLREYDRSRWPKKKKATRKHRLLKLYGISEEQFETMWAQQLGKCGICTIDMLREGRYRNSVVVDHCHATKRVRGLLCAECNQAIGKLHDNPENCMRAARWVA